MNGPRCASAVPFETLVAWWLGELDTAEEAPLEEHLFGCAACTAHLQALARLASGIRAVVRHGGVHAIVSGRFVEQLERDGLRIREYQVGPGQVVACTIRADDDAVVGRMRARLDGVRRLDVVQSIDVGDGRPRQWRVEDVPFDPRAGELLTLPSAAVLKRMPAHTFRVRLLAVDESGERPLGDYTFEHTPG
jgi:hypothetical protein